MEYPSDKITRLRSNLGISQAEFAKSIGYSRSYVKDIESGRVKPSRGFLEALSTMYGVSIDVLLSNFGKQVLSAVNANFISSEGGFIYLYDFTDTGLDMAEQKLLNFLNDTNKKYKAIDGRKIKGIREFYTELFDLEKRGISYRSAMRRHINEFINHLDFIILMRFSQSQIQKDMLRIYMWLFFSKPRSLIVIDRPSYLEKNIKSLYSRAFPIHVKDSFGFVHPPK